MGEACNEASAEFGILRESRDAVTVNQEIRSNEGSSPKTKVAHCKSATRERHFREDAGFALSNKHPARQAMAAIGRSRHSRPVAANKVDPIMLAEMWNMIECIGDTSRPTVFDRAGEIRGKIVFKRRSRFLHIPRDCPCANQARARQIISGHPPGWCGSMTPAIAASP